MQNQSGIDNYREQGVGDEILYASCFPELIERCARCTLTCDARLAPLFRRSFPQATVYGGKPWHDDWKRWIDLPVDYQIPAGNVPRYLRSHIASFPSTAGYLVADRTRRKAWRQRFERLGSGLKVGISWQGGKDLLSLRHAPWDFWREALLTEGARFVNLQYGDCSQQLATMRRRWGVEVHDWDDIDALKDLDGLAAQMADLDLVITVPNTTAHLAGALGVPVWIIFSPAWGCWWITHGVEAPWYPSAKIFPKSREKGWPAVLETLCQELAELVPLNRT